MYVFSLVLDCPREKDICFRRTHGKETCSWPKNAHYVLAAYDYTYIRIALSMPKNDMECHAMPPTSFVGMKKVRRLLQVDWTVCLVLSLYTPFSKPGPKCAFLSI